MNRFHQFYRNRKQRQPHFSLGLNLKASDNKQTNTKQNVNRINLYSSMMSHIQHRCLLSICGFKGQFCFHLFFYFLPYVTISYRQNVKE